MGPLYGRSEYSLLQSLLKVKDYVNMCKQYGYTYATISDHNVLFATKLFNQTAKENNIKPLFGIEFDCLINNNIYQFEAIAKNNNGYIQLIQLSSICANQPVSIDYLSNLNDCVLISFIDNGIFNSCINEDNNTSDFNNFKNIYNYLCQYHKQDNYLALCYQQSKYYNVRNNVAYNYALSIGLPCVAINKTYYLSSKQSYPYLIVRAIGLDKTVSDKSLVMDNDRYLLNIDQYKLLYSNDVLANNDYIASICNVNLDEIETSLPNYPLQDNIDSGTYLTNLAVAGLKKRFNNNVSDVYIQRLKRELDVIHSMGFDDYFLIVFDYIRYAKKKKILVGPGRGSAAGSLVSYSIGITEIDPIANNLLFERFLNPSRATMPDIDTDFPDIDRDDVINYVYEKYGKQHVAHIITFNTLGAKQVIRDVGKVLEFNNTQIDTIAKCIPLNTKISLKQAIESNNQLKQMIYDDNKVKQLFEIALQVEGLPRHCSTHAAGIVFSKKEFSQCVPTIQLGNDMLTIQYSMEYLQDMGLIKMDFLGLKNLTILNEIQESIKRDNPDFSLNNIPLNDANTYKLIAKANTIGIFQLESEGIKQLLKKMQPCCYEDLVAAIALFRPGPMENIGAYLANKANKNNIVYENEKIKEILSPTYGVAIYQEQVMQLSQAIANFSLAKADILRKAMSKKKLSEIEKLKQDFINGAISNGYSNDKALAWFNTIEKFSGYGFNKAHSVAYGLICYQLAYLKCHYPLYFYCAYLNSIIGSYTKINSVINELKAYNIKVLPPDINKSKANFIIEGNNIRYALGTIKGIGSALCQSIINDRNTHGPYLDYISCMTRLYAIKLNNTNMEMLIDAGCMDSFIYNRITMKSNMEEVLRYANLAITINNDDYYIDDSLVSKPDINFVKENLWQKANNEYNALSLFLTYNPYEAMRVKYNIRSNQSLAQIYNRPGRYNGFGLISKLKQHRTKKGDLMAFVVLSDESGNYDASIMPRLYDTLINIIKPGQYVNVILKIDEQNRAIIDKCEVCSLT